MSEYRFINLKVLLLNEEYERLQELTARFNESQQKFDPKFKPLTPLEWLAATVPTLLENKNQKGGA